MVLYRSAEGVRGMRFALVLLVALAASLAACGEPDDDFVRPDPGGSGGGGSDAEGGSGGSGGAGGSGGSGGAGGVGGVGGTGGIGGAGGEWVDVEWERCPDGAGDCTAFDVPLDWEA